MRYVAGPVPHEPERLRDYLESEFARMAEILGAIEGGFWTPRVYGSSTAGTNAYDIQFGRWFTVGTKTFIDFLIAMNTKDGTIAGDVRIDGGFPPPFSYISPSGYGRVIIGMRDVNLGAGYTYLEAIMNPSNYIELRRIGSNQTWASVTVSMLSNTSGFSGSLIYERKP